MAVFSLKAALGDVTPPRAALTLKPGRAIVAVAVPAPSPRPLPSQRFLYCFLSFQRNDERILMFFCSTSIRATKPAISALASSLAGSEKLHVAPCLSTHLRFCYSNGGTSEYSTATCHLLPRYRSALTTLVLPVPFSPSRYIVKREHWILLCLYCSFQPCFPICTSCNAECHLSHLFGTKMSWNCVV